MVQQGRDLVALGVLWLTMASPSLDFEGFVRAGEVRCVCFRFHLFSSKTFEYIFLCMPILANKGINIQEQLLCTACFT